MITGVALRMTDGRVWSLPKPNRHGHLFPLIHQTIGDKKKSLRMLRDHVQGFVDDQGRFLNRREAFDEAFRCNQVLPPYNPVKPSERRGKVDPTPRELFSEDMW